MHPDNITYRNERLPLGHLAQSFREFEWTPKGGVTTKFKVRLRYSSHVYSRMLHDGEEPAEDDVVIEVEPKKRVFCRDRYDHTATLRTMVNSLFARPGTTVSLTYEKNWTIYQLFAKPEAGGQHRYCVFFSVRKTNINAPVNGAYPLDMYVQSAYVR